jgi:hypothetical protein
MKSAKYSVDMNLGNLNPGYLNDRIMSGIVRRIADNPILEELGVRLETRQHNSSRILYAAFQPMASSLGVDGRVCEFDEFARSRGLVPFNTNPPSNRMFGGENFAKPYQCRRVQEDFIFDPLLNRYISRDLLGNNDIAQNAAQKSGFKLPLHGYLVFISDELLESIMKRAGFLTHLQSPFPGYHADVLSFEQRQGLRKWAKKYDPRFYKSLSTPLSELVRNGDGFAYASLLGLEPELEDLNIQSSDIGGEWFRPIFVKDKD